MTTDDMVIERFGASFTPRRHVPGPHTLTGSSHPNLESPAESFGLNARDSLPPHSHIMNETGAFMHWQPPAVYSLELNRSPSASA